MFLDINKAAFYWIFDKVFDIQILLTIWLSNLTHVFFIYFYWNFFSGTKLCFRLITLLFSTLNTSIKYYGSLLLLK